MATESASQDAIRVTRARREETVWHRDMDTECADDSQELVKIYLKKI